MNDLPMPLYYLINFFTNIGDFISSISVKDVLHDYAYVVIFLVFIGVIVGHTVINAISKERYGFEPINKEYAFSIFFFMLFTFLADFHGSHKSAVVLFYITLAFLFLIFLYQANKTNYIIAFFATIINLIYAIGFIFIFLALLGAQNRKNNNS